MTGIFLNICLLTSFCSCNVSPPKPQYIPEHERKRYEEFFKRFLFLESGVYTLYGSKPITEIVLCPETPEQKIALQQAALEKLSPKELAQLKSSGFEYDEECWFEESWLMWEKLMNQLPIKRYLFVERKIGIPPELKKNRYIYFINIAETAKVLKKHYSLFREYVGFDFDPLSVIFEAKDSSSPFWNAIWGGQITDMNTCLMGVLFGYGFENSYPFSWHFVKPKCPEEAEFIAAFLKSGTPTAPISPTNHFDPPNSFLLPGFTSFSEDDPHKERYKHERDKIQTIYKKTNIIECSLKQLLK